MSRFNLIDEPWIPVRRKNGRLVELGLKDVLLTAKDLSGIEDASPLVVASLYRFLLAVLYRALEGPTDIDQAKGLFREGLPSGKIQAYLEKWRDRFWLFDEKYPFGQIPDFKPKAWRAWTVLSAENNADNAKVLFDHVDVEKASWISEAKAARGIMATLTFSVSCGKSELAHTGTAPAATAAMVLPIGGDLHDTLVLALVPQGRELVNGDKALWEREPETLNSLKNDAERSPAGFADRYTWRIRSIRLKDDGEMGVRALAFASGVKPVPSGQIDPMLAYRIDENRGILPRQFTDRGLWRDFDSLLPDEKGLCPQVINHSIELTRRSRDRFPRSMLILGQSNNKAKIEYWRLERYVLPEAVLGDISIRSTVHRFLQLASEVQKVIYAASRQFARDRLSRGERVPAGKDISSFVTQLPGTPSFWSTLESRFQEILHAYTFDADPDVIEYQWLKFVRTALKDAWELQRNSLSSGDAWTLRALAKSEAPVCRKLGELDDQIKKYQAHQLGEKG